VFETFQRPDERIEPGGEERGARYLHVTENRVGFII
jgi:hypothetical protein